jgi:hypothetical protein
MHQDISVDESPAGAKNETSLMKHLLNKHHHCWMLCDSVSNYCLGFSYTKEPGLRKTAQLWKKWPAANHREKTA